MNDKDINYDRALKRQIHNTEVAERIVGTFLIAETVILGFLGSSFLKSCCCNTPELSNQLLLFGGSVFGLLLVIPWWGSYSYRLYFSKFWLAKMKEFGNNMDEEAKILSEKGTFTIGEKNISIEPFTIKARNAYRMMMIIFAMAFAVMAIISFHELLHIIPKNFPFPF